MTAVCKCTSTILDELKARQGVACRLPIFGEHDGERVCEAGKMLPRLEVIWQQ